MSAILEGALDCIITADHRGRIVDFNPAAERTFGYRRDDVVGRELAEIVVPPSLREAHRQGFAHHLATGETRVLGKRVELTGVRSDGSEFPIELTITSISLDGRPFFTGFIRDITDRRRAEEELRRGAAYLAQAQRLTHTGIWVWNPRTDQGFASEEAYRMFGFAPDEQAANVLQDFALRVHPDDRPLFDRAVDAARSEQRDFEVNYRIVRADGEIRHVHALGHPVVAATGELREFVGTVMDVTDQRLAEEAQQRRAKEAALRAEIGGLLSRADTLRRTLQGAAEAIVKHLDGAFARIWSVNRGGTLLELQASAGLHTNIEGAHARIPIGALKIGLIAEQRVPLWTNDVAGDSRIHDKEWARRNGLVSFAGYPLLVDERVVGVIAMFARHALPQETLAALDAVASLVAQGIERKRSEEQLRRSEAYLAEGQRLSHTGSWAWRLDTGERFWSREVFRIYGFDVTDPPPPLEAVIQRVHAGDIVEVRRIIDEALHTHTEFRLRARIVIDGQPVKYVETVGHPVRDESGRVNEFIGTDIDITESYRANRRLRRAIRARYEAVLAERARIARDMHDGLLQDVTGIALQLGALVPHVRATPDLAAERLQAILDLTQRMSREARLAVVGFRTDTSAGDSVEAVATVARRIAATASLSLSFKVEGRARPLRPNLHDAVAMVVQEAMSNVVKHADAAAVHLVLTFRQRGLRVSIADDGVGFASSARAMPGHFGLLGMRERAGEVGASIDVQSSPGGGTVVTLVAPYRR